MPQMGLFAAFTMAFMTIFTQTARGSAHKLAIWGLVALVFLPFLVPWHTEPLPTFYNIWLALACGLLCLPALCDQRGVLIPRVVLAPLVVLAAIGLQYFWLPNGLQVHALVAILILVWVCLLMPAVVRLREEIGMARLGVDLAAAIALMAVLNAVGSLLFHTGIRGSLGGLLLHADPRGNLAQVNHLADVLWLGIASMLYGWRQAGGRMRWMWAAALPLLLLASAFTGARAPYVYALWLSVIAWLSGDAPLRRATVLVAVAYVGIAAIVHWLPVSASASDSFARIASAAHFGSGGNVRLGLIHVAAGIAAEHSLLGAGWGSFSWVSYQHVTPGLDWQGTAEHAHQLFFQLAAEVGIPAALGVAGALALWLAGAWQQRRDLAVCWAAGAAGIVLLHAQVEYPLWYAHFLGMCCLLLALSEQRVYAMPQWRFKPLTVVVVMLSGFYLLASTAYDYVRLEQWMYRDMARGERKVTERDYYRVLGEWYKGSLLKPNIELVLAALMDPTADNLDAKRIVCERALATEPQTPSAFTCALLDELAGDTEKAERRWRLAMIVFRDQLPGYLADLEKRLSDAQRQPLQRLLSMAKAELMRAAS